jgi:acetolactate synthase-1/2/3 large subunit
MAGLLVTYLEQLGIQFVFGTPDPLFAPLYEALRNSTQQDGVRLIEAPDGYSAILMACGYARETGKPGVCCAPLSNDISKFIAGIEHAWHNHIPLMLITTAHPLSEETLEDGAVSMEDNLSLFHDCTNFNAIVANPESVEGQLVQALHWAKRIPARPVHLCIPADLFAAPNPEHIPAYDLEEFLHSESLTDNDGIAQLMDMLSTARGCGFVIGGDCVEAMPAIVQFATLMNEAMPAGVHLITTPEGKGMVNGHHPLFRGVLGLGGHTLAEAALRNEEVDLIVAIGIKPYELLENEAFTALLNERLIHIDETDENFEYTPMARLQLHGRIMTTFHHLLDAYQGHWFRGHMPDHHDEPALVCVPDTDAGHMMRSLGPALPPSACFLVDSSNLALWATHYLQSSDRRVFERRIGGGNRARTHGRRTLRSSWMRLALDQVENGWSIASALGTVVAAAHQPVICLAGSRGLLANESLLRLAAQEDMQVLFFVFHDDALAEQPDQADQLAHTEAQSVALTAMADTTGIPLHTVATRDDWTGFDLPAVLARTGPSLINVRFGAAEMPFFARHHMQA